MPPRSLPVLRPLALATALLTAAAACVALWPARTAPWPPAGAGAVAYVADEGSGDVAAIDTETDEVLWTVRVERLPRAIRPGRGGQRIFVAVSGSAGAPAWSPAGSTRMSPATLDPDGAADGIAVVDAAVRLPVCSGPAGIP